MNRVNNSVNPIEIQRRDARHWRVKLNNPPLNLLDPEMVNSLHDLIEELERSEDIRVVVFESALDDFFMAHVDLIRIAEGAQETGPTGLLPWADFLRRMEKAPFISIGLIRGRARGVGSEFLQAFDMRFASREKAIFAQVEVGCGIIPGGGGLDRLPGMVGRGRAMEIICGADDFDAEVAERYGWINRSVPDAELDGFVEGLATRIAGFEKETLALAKTIINERVPFPSVAELDNTYKRFRATLGWPGAQRRIALLIQKGLQSDADFERDLAAHIAEL